jgi:anti-anti-sigma factor
MRLEKKRFEDIVILRFVGEFDTFNLPLFSERVDRMINGGDRFFVLDVKLLTFINSTALGYLIKMSNRLQEQDGDMVLARPSKFVRKTLVTLGLEEKFPIFETDADALQHFRRGADVGRLQLESTEHDEALHGATPLLFYPRVEKGEQPPNQVGRIVNLYSDGLLFRYEPAGEDDPVEGSLTPGTKLQIKFRQPFALKDHYFEMDADVTDVSDIEEIEEGGSRVLNVRVTYGKVKDEDRGHLDQFVKDQEIWRGEVGS